MGGLFEDIQVTNYNTQPVTIQISLSFDADFIDVFEIRGYKDRPQRGTPLRELPSSDKELLSEDLPGVALSTEELALAYQGLDGALMESHIRFSQNHTDSPPGQYGVLGFDPAPHESRVLSYRVQLLLDNQSAAVHDIPGTPGTRANAAKLDGS